MDDSILNDVNELIRSYGEKYRRIAEGLGIQRNKASQMPLIKNVKGRYYRSMRRRNKIEVDMQYPYNHNKSFNIIIYNYRLNDK